MSILKKLFIWYLLLNKRFLKKPGLWAILIIIPLLVVALGIVSMQDSGIISIALAAEDNSDSLATSVIDEISKDDRLMRFVISKTPAEAEELVKSGKVDAAWIFPDNMEQRLTDFVTTKQSLIRILEREETVPLMLAREKLCGIVYKNCSSTLYIKYIRSNLKELNNISDDKLMEYYNTVKVEGDELFEFSYTDPDHATDDAKAGYLMTPVRGLMAVMLILSGLAAAMFYNDDDDFGTFAWVSGNHKPFVAGVFHIIPISLTAVSMLLSLYFSGLWVGIIREILIAFLYVICVAIFCMIIRLICRSNKVMGAVTPIMILAFMVVCPVFIDIKILRPVQYFLPTFHYLSAVHNDKFIIFMVIYAFIAAVFYFMLSKIVRKA